MTYASVVEKGCKGETKNLYPIAFKVEVKHLEWLDNCFIGKTMEPTIEEEFVINIRSCYIGDWENSSDDDELERDDGGRVPPREPRRPDVAMKDMGDDVEGQQISGLQNTRHLNEAIDELGPIPNAREAGVLIGNRVNY
ncbi:hypothetical protein VNO80_25111 [Phaseolus coccineus]|uniref:Uncharacterized protein n=1 Tax=Phaseolus coccineus TaxID=3886 RepID=A0AAN9QT10_PHACN